MTNYLKAIQIYLKEKSSNSSIVIVFLLSHGPLQETYMIPLRLLDVKFCAMAISSIAEGTVLRPHESGGPSVIVTTNTDIMLARIHALY